MAEYIEKTLITTELPFVMMKYGNYFNERQIEKIVEIVYELENSIEAANVQAVRHGHWIEEVREIGETFRLYQTYIHCSECGKEHYSGTLPKPNFCDECGTRMDGDINE